MATDRLRVVPALQPRGFICAAAVLGMAYMLIWEGYDHLARRLSVRTFPMSSNLTLWYRLWDGVLAPILQVCVPVVLVYAAVLMLMRLNQRLGLALACGAAYGAAAMAVSGLVLFLGSDAAGDPIVVPWMWALTLMLGEAAVGAILGVAVFACFRWIIRRTHFRLIEQTGRFCWRCAYDVGADGIACCPECATPMSSDRFRLQWLVSGIQRHLWISRLLLALMVALIFGITLFVSVRGPTSAASQFQAVSDGMTKFNHAQLAFIAGLSSPTMPVPWYPANDGSARAIAACRSRTQAGTGPIWIQVLVPPGPKGSSTEGTLVEGDVWVYAPLNDAQARWVSLHGVPLELEQALLAEATHLKWKPPPSGTFTATGMTLTSPRNASSIDPSTFVPSTPDSSAKP